MCPNPPGPPPPIPHSDMSPNFGGRGYPYCDPESRKGGAHIYVRGPCEKGGGVTGSPIILRIYCDPRYTDRWAR